MKLNRLSWLSLTCLIVTVACGDEGDSSTESETQVPPAATDQSRVNGPTPNPPSSPGVEEPTMDQIEIADAETPVLLDAQSPSDEMAVNPASDDVEAEDELEPGNPEGAVEDNQVSTAEAPLPADAIKQGEAELFGDFSCTYKLCL